MSSTHCSLRLERSGRLMLTDLSSNGTFVDGVAPCREGSRQTALGEGQTIALIPPAEEGCAAAERAAEERSVASEGAASESGEAAPTSASDGKPMGLTLQTSPVSVVEQLGGSASRLRTLDLSRNKLDKLPEQWAFPKLTTCNLSQNRLTRLPELSAALKKLDASENRLTDVVSCLTNAEAHLEEPLLCGVLLVGPQLGLGLVPPGFLGPPPPFRFAEGQDLNLLLALHARRCAANVAAGRAHTKAFSGALRRHRPSAADMQGTGCLLVAALAHRHFAQQRERMQLKNRIKIASH